MGSSYTRFMPVLMILLDGPLDGEDEVVEMVPTAPGSQLLFNIPHFQTFDPNAPDEVVIGLGLQAVYAFVGPGPPPDPDVDRWDTSWIYEFTGEAYVPTPPDVPTPPNPPVDVAQVWMSATTTLVPDTIPIITSPVVTLVAESGMDVDATTTPTQSAEVDLSGESVMTVIPDWNPTVVLQATTGLGISADITPGPIAGGGYGSGPYGEGPYGES